VVPLLGVSLGTLCIAELVAFREHIVLDRIRKLPQFFGSRQLAHLWTTSPGPQFRGGYHIVWV